MKHYFSIEIWASVLLGSFSCGLISFFSGFPALMDYVDSLNLATEQLIYLAILYIFYLLYIFSINRAWLVVPTEGLTLRLSIVIKEIGPSLIGVFRVIAGALIVLGPAAMIIEGNLKAYVFGGSGVIFAIAIMWISAKVNFLLEKIG